MSRHKIPSWVRSFKAWCGIAAAVAGVVAAAYGAYTWNSTRVQEDVRLRDTVNRHTEQIDKNDDRLTRVEATVNKIDGKVDTVIKILTKQESADEAVARGNK